MRSPACQNHGMRPLRDFTVLAGATLALLLGPSAIAGAETYTVTRTDDPAPGPCMPGDCSVREALKASNESTTVDDVIQIPAAADHYAIDLGQLETTDDVEVHGAGADRVVLDAGGASIAVRIEGRVLLEGLTITGGQGGIQNGGELTLRRVTIEHNDRIDGGGGGIQSNGPLTVESSFIGFNTTNNISGSAIQSNDPVTIVNSTVASNESLGPAIQSNAGLKLSSSAVVFNTRLEAGDAAGIKANPPTTLADSIVAANRTPDGTQNCAPSDEFTSQGGNVEDDATCDPGSRDRANAAPGLGTLELHGGTTPVFSLLPGSAAVDFALNCPPTDQRGGVRPQGAACDSGPFELGPTAAATAPKDESVTVLIGRGKVHINEKGFGRVRLTCPSSEQSPPCSGVLFLRKRALPIGAARTGPIAKAKFKIGAGKTKRVRLHLTSSAVEGLREKSAARKVLAFASVSDAAANSGQAKHIVHLVPPKRR